MGEYYCNKCGMMQITNPEFVTVIYPKGIDKPRAKVYCEGCDTTLMAFIEWRDALIFDSAGSNVEGFSFINGPVVTAEEIDGFVENFDSEIEEFLNACKIQ
jgi:hypothetical protein